MGMKIKNFKEADLGCSISLKPKKLVVGTAMIDHTLFYAHDVRLFDLLASALLLHAISVAGYHEFIFVRSLPLTPAFDSFDKVCFLAADW